MRFLPFLKKDVVNFDLTRAALFVREFAKDPCLLTLGTLSEVRSELELSLFSASALKVMFLRFWADLGPIMKEEYF